MGTRNNRMYQLDQVTLLCWLNKAKKKKKRRREENLDVAMLWEGKVIRMRRDKSYQVMNKMRGRWEGICVKCISQHFSLSIFLPIWKDKKSGSRRENSLPIFCFSYFLSSTKQWKIAFSTIFFSPYFSSSLFSPQPNTP